MTKSVSQSGTRLDRIDTFVLAGVLTIFLTRSFLAFTNYPQIGNDSLHIAHVLWGGLLLTVAFLILLLANTPNRLFIALVGGIGFGLFIDEIGKFITQDNDYFYEPAVGLMYISFLLIWIISRLVIIRAEHTTFLSPAEWPSKRWMRGLIVTWAVIQVVTGVLLLTALMSKGTSFVSETLHIPLIGLAMALLYVGVLSYGLWHYFRGRYMHAAHELRGATIFGIVGLFPFIFLNHPEIATFTIIPLILVTLGLSEVSVTSLLRKLVIR